MPDLGVFCSLTSLNGAKELRFMHLNGARHFGGLAQKPRAISALMYHYSKSQSSLTFLNARMTAMMCYVFAYNYGDFHEQRSN